MTGGTSVCLEIIISFSNAWARLEAQRDTLFFCIKIFCDKKGKKNLTVDNVLGLELWTKSYGIRMGTTQTLSHDRGMTAHGGNLLIGWKMMAQLVKRLSCRFEDLSSIPRTHVTCQAR